MSRCSWAVDCVGTAFCFLAGRSAHARPIGYCICWTGTNVPVSGKPACIVQYGRCGIVGCSPRPGCIAVCSPHCESKSSVRCRMGHIPIKAGYSILCARSNQPGSGLYLAGAWVRCLTRTVKRDSPRWYHCSPSAVTTAVPHAGPPRSPAYKCHPWRKGWPRHT